MIEMLLQEPFRQSDSGHVCEEGRYLTSIIIAQAHICRTEQDCSIPVFNFAVAVDRQNHSLEEWRGPAEALTRRRHIARRSCAPGTGCSYNPSLRTLVC